MNINELLDIIEEGNLNEGQRDPESPLYMAGMIMGHLAAVSAIAVKLERKLGKDAAFLPKETSGLLDVARKVRMMLDGHPLLKDLMRISRMAEKNKDLPKTDRLAFRQGKVDAFKNNKYSTAVTESYVDVVQQRNAFRLVGLLFSHVRKAGEALYSLKLEAEKGKNPEVAQNVLNAFDRAVPGGSKALNRFKMMTMEKMTGKELSKLEKEAIRVGRREGNQGVSV